MKIAASNIIISKRSANVEAMRLWRYHKPEDFVEMRINPQRISVDSRKVINKVQTNTRWVFQHWGIEPSIIRYSGVTGYIRSFDVNDLRKGDATSASDHQRNELYPLPDTTVTSPYETRAFQALMVLRTFYEEPHKSLQGRSLTQLSGADIDDEISKLLLVLSYRDSKYIGYLTTMEISEQEKSPWSWDYRMEFQAVHWNSRVKLGKYTISDLVNALYSTSTSGYNDAADSALNNAWRKGLVATSGGTNS